MRWMGVVLLLGPLAGPAAAQSSAETPLVLTPARVLELARLRSPDVLLSEAAIRGSRGRLSAARSVLPANPTAEILSATDRRLDRRPSYAVTVPLELGFKRARRIGVARSELERDQRRIHDNRRLAAGGALAAYYGALHAERRVALAVDRRRLAEELGRLTDERHRSGEAAELDVKVAIVELARASSEVSAAQGEAARRRTDLATILGLPSGAAIELQGDLADRSLLPLRDGESGAGDRSDVRAAESELKAANAARSLARLWILPDFALRLDYDREDAGSVLRRGVSFNVPLADWGQVDRAEAAVRRSQAEIELATRRASARAEAEGARSAYVLALEAVDRLEEVGLVSAQETQSMAEESYRAGKINLAALIVVRHEAIEARRDHVDRLLEAAIAGIDLAVARETLP